MSIGGYNHITELIQRHERCCGVSANVCLRAVPSVTSVTSKMDNKVDTNKNDTKSEYDRLFTILVRCQTYNFAPLAVNVSSP